MAKGIEIDFIADVAPFVRETAKVEKSLEETADSLDDLAKESERAADRSGEALADAFDDAAKDSKKDLDKVADAADDTAKDVDGAAEKMERSFGDAFDEAGRKAKTTGDGISADTRRSFRDAGDASQTFRDEAKQNLSETVSSFRGDAEDIPQIFQDVFGGVVSDLGPAGVVGGALAAAGIGIAVALFQQGKEEANELKEKVIDVAEELRSVDGDMRALDWGSLFAEFGREIADAASWFEPWQKENISNFEQLKEAADNAGIAYADLFQGMAGDADQAQASIAALDEQIDDQQQVVDGLTNSVAAYGGELTRSNGEEIAKLVNLRDLKEKLEAAVDSTNDAVEMEELMEAATKGSAAALEEKNEKLREQADLTADAVASELDYLDAIAESTTTLKENSEDGFSKNTAAGRDNQRALIDIADATKEYAQSVLDQSGNQQVANDIIAEGRQKVLESSDALAAAGIDAEDFADALGLIPSEVSTEAIAETAKAEEDLNYVTRDRTVVFRPSVSGAALQAELNRAAGSVTKPSVEVRMRAGRYVLGS